MVTLLNVVSAWIRQQQDLAADEQRQRLDSQNAKLAAIRQVVSSPADVWPSIKWLILNISDGQDTARRRKEQERRLVEQKNEQERQRQVLIH